MKIVKYQDVGEDLSSTVWFETQNKIWESIEANPDFRREWIDERIPEALSPKGGLVYSYVTDQMIFVLQAIGGIENLKGKTFLDLGCGSKNTKYSIDRPNPGYDHEQFEPWLCRMLPYLGTKTIGVDIQNLDEETFEHYTADLLKENSLSFLPDNSVDIAHTRWMICAPSVIKAVCGDKKIEERKQVNKSRKKVLDLLIPQLERIVKPEGVFVYND